MLSIRFSRLSFVAFLLFALIPWAAAQQGGKDGNNTTTPDTGKPTNKVPARPDVSAPPTRPRMPQLPEAPLIFISGVVELVDGSPPPFGASIELDCRGSITRQTMVEGTGNFSFQVGDKNRFSRLMPDASEGYYQDMFNRNPPPGSENDPASRRLAMMQPAMTLVGCEIRAQLNGYRSSVVRFEREPDPGPNDVGTIVVYPIEKVKGTTVSAKSLLAPKQAQKSLSRAKKAIEKQKYGKAEEYLKSATGAYPEYGDAWFELGAVYHNQGRVKEARAAYLRAMEADEFYVSPYIGLGALAAKEQKWQEAADFAARAIDLDPLSFPEAYFLNALANCNLNNLDAAEKSARQLQRLDPGHRFPKVFLVLSNIYALRRDAPASIEEMRNYLRYAPNAADADNVRALLKEKIAQAGSR